MEQAPCVNMSVNTFSVLLDNRDIQPSPLADSTQFISTELVNAYINLLSTTGDVWVY